MDTLRFQNQLDAIVRENCNDNKRDWRTACLMWLYQQLESVDLSGDAVLDTLETPEIPEHLFYKLDEKWGVEKQIQSFFQKMPQWQTTFR